MTKEEREKLKEEIIEDINNTSSSFDIGELGLWIFRCILVVGAIIGFMTGNERVGSGCISGIVISFLFL